MNNLRGQSIQSQQINDFSQNQRDQYNREMLNHRE